MEMSEWLAAAMAIPAALVLMLIAIGSALDMSLQEAKSLRHGLAVCVAGLMILAGLDRWMGIRSVPLMDWAIDSVAFAMAMFPLYCVVAGVAFQFRRRRRKIGLQLLVVGAVTLWWVMLGGMDGVS